MSTHWTKLLLGLFSLFCLLGCGVGNNVNVVLRYDDFSNSSPTHLEKKLLNGLENQNASITFGAIPNRNGSSPLSLKKAELLSKAAGEGTVDLAQHGYTHQAVVTEPKKSEFAHLGYDAQVERLRKGKQLLEQVTNLSINTFIPPWNRWDLNTRKALEATGFETLSSRVGAGEALTSTSINHISGTVNDLSRLRTIVDMSNKTPFLRGLIVVVVHPYDFKSVNEKRGIVELSGFQKDVDWISSKKGISVTSIEDVSETSSKFGPGTFRLNTQVRSLLPLLPPAEAYPLNYIRNLNNIYHTSNTSLALIFLIITCLYILCFSLSMVVSYQISKLLLNIKTNFAFAYIFLSFLFFVFIFVYSFHDLKAHWLGALCSTSALGICIGSLLVRPLPNWIRRA